MNKEYIFWPNLTLSGQIRHDLFHCEIRSLEDFRRYKNAMYEFKPNYKNYDFIVPSRNISKTLKKMQFSLKKINEKKFNN